MKFKLRLLIIISIIIQGCANNRIPSALSSNLFMSFPSNLNRIEFDKLVNLKNKISEKQGYVIPFKGNFILSENFQKKLYLDNYYFNNTFFRADDREFLKLQLNYLSKLPQHVINMSDFHRKILGVGQISWEPESQYEKLRDSVNLTMNNLINNLRLKYSSKNDYAEYKSVERKQSLIKARGLDMNKMRISKNYRNNSRIRVESDFGILMGSDKVGLNFAVDSKYKIYSGDYVGVKLGRMYMVRDYNSNQNLDYFAITYEHIPQSNLATNRYNNFHFWGFGLGLFKSDILMNNYTNIYNRNSFETQIDYIPGIFVRNGTQIGPIRFGYAFYFLPKIEFSKPGGAVMGISNTLFNLNFGYNIGGRRWQ